MQAHQQPPFINPTARGLLNSSLRLCAKKGTLEHLPEMLREGADGIEPDKSSIFKVAAMHKQLAMFEALARQLPPGAAFNTTEVSEKNNWILELMNKEETIPYVLAFIKQTPWLYQALSAQPGSIILKGIFTQLLIKAVECNQLEMTKLLLEKRLLANQDEKVGNDLMNIAVEKTKKSQMIALLKKFGLGQKRAAAVVEPNPTSLVEMALALNEKENPVFFIIEHYFVKKLTENSGFSADIRIKLKIFSTLVRITLNEAEPLLVEQQLKDYFDSKPFPLTMTLTSTDFIETVFAVLAYRGQELRTAGQRYVSQLNALNSLQPSILAHINYGDNLLFQLHFILFAEEASLPKDKFTRWSTDVSNIIIDLTDKEAMNIEHFKNIIYQASYTTIIGLSRPRFGEIHDIQRALLPLCDPNNTEKRIEMYAQYKEFLHHNQLGGGFNNTLRETLKTLKARQQEKLLKTLV